MNFSRLIVGALCCIIASHAVRAGNILVISLCESHSHAFHTNVLTEALAARGHKLVVLSPDKEKKRNENITTIFLEGGYDHGLLNSLEDFTTLTPGFMSHTHFIFNYTLRTSQSLLFSDGNKRFYRDYRNHGFDVILFDVASPESFLKYAHIFGYPPIVGFTAFFSIYGHNLGDFEHEAYVPHFMSTLSDRMTFLERLANWFQYKYYFLARRYSYLPKMDKMAEEFFGFNEPTSLELTKKIEIILTNEHFSITPPKPRVPASIEVAGFHIKPPRPLPQDIEKFVSKAKDGVIFFSLGSNFLSQFMSNERKRMFLDAFAQLPQRVLWKYEDEGLTNIPENVLIRKWFPQTDVLGHNNTVLFITHNGFLSTQESIYFGVPMLGIPLLMDQFKNTVKMVQKGLEQRLDLNDINHPQDIVDKIRTILSTQSFKDNVQKTSTFFRDRPMSPLDTAVYWIEYVLRHKGTKQLQVASLDLNWYQYYLLDVYLTTGVAILVVYYCITRLVNVAFQKSEKVKKS